MSDKKADRRKHPRFVVREKTKGRIATFDEVSLVNISLGGALIEHTQVIRPGTFSDLDLAFQGEAIKVRSRVVWSVVARQEIDLDGEGVMVYHSGVEFQDLAQEARLVISHYFHTMAEGGKDTSLDEPGIRRSYLCEKCGQYFELADSRVLPVFLEPRKRPVQAGDLFYHDHEPCEGALTCVFGGPTVPWSGR